MHRHAVGDRRAPGGVGAGVEVAVELDGGQAPVRVAGEARRDLGGMALGRGRHGFGPRVGCAHRAVEEPGRRRDERLEREVELAAEAATRGRRHDAHLPRCQAQHEGELVAVHVWRLGAGDDLDAVLAAGTADAPRITGLGLDIGMLDEGGREAALGHRRRLGEARREVARLNAAAHQHVVRVIFVKAPCARRHGRGNAGERRLGLPADRHLLVGDGGDRCGVAHECHNRLAAEAHAALGQHRLVLDVGIDAEAVLPGDVLGGEHAHEARMPASQLVERPDGEARAGVGRAHGAQGEGVGGRCVVAEALGAGELGDAVGLGEAGADGAAGCRRLGLRSMRALRGGEHRVYDLAVAGAAAEHAAESILDRPLVGPRIAREEIARRHQHAGRADAALRGAVAMEGELQRVEGTALGQALDRDDLAARRLPGGHEAGANLLAVHQHRAGAAVARVAADLGAGQAQLLAQDLGQPCRRRDGKRDAAAVDFEAQEGLLGVHGAAPSSLSARRTSVNAASRR